MMASGHPNQSFRLHTATDDAASSRPFVHNQCVGTVSKRLRVKGFQRSHAPNPRQGLSQDTSTLRPFEWMGSILSANSRTRPWQ